MYIDVQYQYWYRFLNVFRGRNPMKNLSMLKIYQCKLKLDLPLKGHSTQ